MPFTEEAPKPLCGCKNRTCPFQRLYVDYPKNKKYLTYNCDKPELWIVCLRWVDPKTKTEKQEPEPKPAIPAEEPKATQEQEKNRCNNYPNDCPLCSPNQQDKCGIEPQHRKL